MSEAAQAEYIPVSAVADGEVHPGFRSLGEVPLEELRALSEEFLDLRKRCTGWGAMGIGLKKEYVAIVDCALSRLLRSRLAMEPKA